MVPALVGQLVPLLALAVWHLRNRLYPSQNASMFWERTQDYYLRFKAHGLWDALRMAYHVRDWRGILLPPLGLPAMILCNGNVLVAHALTCLAMFSLLLFYVFRILRLFLSPWRAALGTILVGMIPWLQQAAHDFNTEISMLLCIGGALFHLLRARHLDSLRDGIAFGLWMGLGLTIRPAEMALVFGLPLIVGSVHLVRAGKLSLGDVVLPLVQSAAIGTYILSKGQPSGGWGIALFAPTFVGLGLVLARKLNRVLFWADQCLYLPVVLWFWPASGLVEHWLTANSFGSDAISSGGVVGPRPSDLGIVQFVLRVFRYLGGWPFYILAGAVLLSRVWKKLPRDAKGYLPLAILPSLLIGSVSPNSDIRYYIDVALISWVVLAVLLLDSSRALTRLRYSLLSLVLLFFGWVCGVSAFDWKVEGVPPAVLRIFPDYFAQNELWPYKILGAVSPDPWIEIVRRLEQMAPKDFGNDVLYYCHIYGDNPRLTLISRDQGHGWLFDHPNMPNASAQLDDLLSYLRERKSSIVVFCPPAGASGNSLAEAMMKLEISGSFGKYGFTRLGSVDEYQMAAYRYGPPRGTE